MHAECDRHFGCSYVTEVGSMQAYRRLMHRTTLRAKDRVYARRLALARAVQKRKSVLFYDGEEGGPNKAEARQRGWEEVKLELVGKGFVEFAGKSRQDIRKTDWQHVRRYVMDKRKREAQTGIVEDPITELDEVVMEIVGAEGLLSKGSDDLVKREVSNQLLERTGDVLASSSKSDSAELEQDNSLEQLRLSQTPANLLLPQFLQCLQRALKLQSFQDPSGFASSIPQLVANPGSQEERDFDNKLREWRLQREEYVTGAEKLRMDIEAERLLQEKIRTRLLMSELAKLDPQALAELARPNP